MNEEILDENYWNNRYITSETGWDMQEVSTPLKEYINQLHDKKIKILIPGCGNSYEAAYLVAQGFLDITIIDIAPLLVKQLKEKFALCKTIKVIRGDFFEHSGVYDLILEQTFFCALQPLLRTAYAQKMYSLLLPGGKIAGVLFNRYFEQPGPPFGGNVTEYKKLFEKQFYIKQMEPCYNSHSKRMGAEVFVIFVKR